MLASEATVEVYAAVNAGLTELWEEIPEGARLAVGRKERKFATALFADLVGSTALGEREDPEVVESVVGRAFDRMAEQVEL
ncbi:MAG: hypothetical protein ACRD02_01170 [Acidimicrobiia bacterium]